MKQIFVNEIVQGGNITHGYAAFNDIVGENLEIIYPTDELRYLFNTIDGSPLGKGVFLDKYCQFIIYVRLQLRPEIDFGMVVIDCHGDVDAALDEYLMYSKNDWDEASKTKFMSLFLEIQTDNKIERAEMIIKNQISS